MAVLDKIAAASGFPEFIRCDNGPGLTANALRNWCRFTGAGTSYIDPGSPWQNPWVESYGSPMRDELLATGQFSSLLEAQVLVADWRQEYNNYRPHSALGMRIPARVRPNLPDQPTTTHITGGPATGVRSPASRPGRRAATMAGSP